MSEQDGSKLRGCIESISGKIKRYQSRSLGEQNTKASLIEPLLESLGWDVRDPDEVHREFKAVSADKPVDYAMQMLRKPRLFIEAKGLGENLADRKWISQILSYATVAGVTYCILTDGDEYRFYNSNAPLDAEEKLFGQIRLSDGVSDRLIKMLDLISRKSIEANLLDQFWEAHFVDRRVKATLETLLTTADRRLVRLVRQANARLSPREIAESIRRHNFQIESTPTLRANDVKPSTPIAASRTRGKGKLNRKGTRTEFGVDLRRLIEAKLLETPLRLYRKYKGRTIEATLQSDGTVEFAGKRYDSPSKAAEQARRTVTGRDMNTNGWSFWQYSDGSGKPRELLHAREAYLDSEKGTF
ncbi:MAG TPA: hypothetical protein VMP01_30045 [Pirellulaceae bacterium]|nr:hypothetical protein [Pirellulaceae bacterium]